MKNERGSSTVFDALLILVVIAACIGFSTVANSPCFWGSVSCGGATSINTPIPMINPQGFPQRDQQNANSNVDNSVANLNNSEARQNDAESQAILKSIDAQNTKTAAEACELRRDCSVYVYKDGQSSGVGLGVVGAVLIGIVCFLGFAIIFGRK